MEKRTPFDYEDTDIKISIIFPKKISRLLANATVSLNTSRFGFLTIKGFQIWESSNFNQRLQEGININTPKQRFYSKYVYTSYFEDESGWHEIEGLIYSAYLFARSKRRNKTEAEEINKEPKSFGDIPTVTLYEQ